VPVPEDVYEMAQNSPKSESWKRSLNKYTLGRFVPEEPKMTREEPVFPVFDDDEDNVRKVGKLRRSKSLHSKHKITIPPRPASASSIPMKTSVDSSAISPLTKVQAKSRPHSAATTLLHNSTVGPVKSVTPTKTYSCTTPFQNSEPPTSSPVTPTKPSVATPALSGDTNHLVKKLQTSRSPAAGNVSSVTPPVVGNLVQEKAKLFGPTANVKRSQSLSTRNYQRSVKHNDKFVSAANNSPPVTGPATMKNTSNPQEIQNTATTSPPISNTTYIDQSSVKELTNSPVDVPWQAAMINSEGIPWQARAANNSTK